MRLSRESVCTALTPSSFLSTYMVCSSGSSKPVWYFSATMSSCPSSWKRCLVWASGKPLSPASVNVSQRFSEGLSGEMAGVREPAGDVSRGHCVQCGGDRGVQGRPGARGRGLDQGLDLAEGLLDRRQVRRVSGQEHQLAAGGFDQRADPVGLVRAGVVD